MKAVLRVIATPLANPVRKCLRETFTTVAIPTKKHTPDGISNSQTGMADQSKWVNKSAAVVSALLTRVSMNGSSHLSMKIKR